MRSHVTEDFRDLLASLPEQVQRQAEDAYALFQQDPHHPGLQVKQLSGHPGIYSVRVGLRYRALAYRTDDDLYWFWIGTHADYDHVIATF
jgi:mRNA-degrading endonuclease RelE of RelBE toxin-antitoxin system